MFIWDFVAATVLNEIIDWVYIQTLGFLTDFFATMGNMGVELFDLLWVQTIIQFFSQLGWALFGVALVVTVFQCALEYSNGRGNIQGTALDLIKGFLAVNLFTVVPIRLYTLAVSLQGTFTAALVGEGGSIGSIGQEILADFATTEGLTESIDQFSFGLGAITSPFMVLFSVLLMAYAVIKVFFANLKRGGILLIQIAVGSLHMFSLPRGYEDGFTQWMKQIIALCLTAFLQATMLTAGLLIFKERMLLGLGLMLSSGEIPRIAGSFGLDTSTKASLTSAVYTAQAAVNTTRNVVAAVAK